MQNIYYMHWQVGEHTRFSISIENTILEGIRSGMNTIQFFMGDPKQAWQRDKISEEDIKRTNKLLYRFPMNVFTHYPFCANLAGQASKGCLAWSGVDENKTNPLFEKLEFKTLKDRMKPILLKGSTGEGAGWLAICIG